MLHANLYIFPCNFGSKCLLLQYAYNIIMYHTNAHEDWLKNKDWLSTRVIPRLFQMDKVSITMYSLDSQQSFQFTPKFLFISGSNKSLCLNSAHTRWFMHSLATSQQHVGVRRHHVTLPLLYQHAANTYNALNCGTARTQPTTHIQPTWFCSIQYWASETEWNSMKQ